MMTLLVTGGAGFIGSNFIKEVSKVFDEKIVNLDKLTYATVNSEFSKLSELPQYELLEGDIIDGDCLRAALIEYKPRAIINFAAETHVDRSISEPDTFVLTNVVGTHQLLKQALGYVQGLTKVEQEDFRFIHVSTDEVYGSLSLSDKPFDEQSRYQPNNPYSATKASSDHLVRSYYKTYGLPTVITNCSNNYGPGQDWEKLIPKVIRNAILGETIPIYGEGNQIRDWLYVKDHCSALINILKRGRIGEAYNIGGNNEYTNLDLVQCLLRELELHRADFECQHNYPFMSLVTFVKDRPGHDERYSIDALKIRNELGWTPEFELIDGLRETISWYAKYFN